MATLVDFLGTGALAPFIDDILAVGYTQESFFALLEANAIDTINNKVLPDAAKNAFWLRKLLFEASPKLLLEHGDKFEANFITENAVRAYTWEELKAQVAALGVIQDIQLLALYVKLGHALPFNPQEQLTPQVVAELKQEGIHFHVPPDVLAASGMKRQLDHVTSPPEQKQKKRRDKNAPKRARSAYLVFLDRNRQAIMAHNPQMPMSEVTRILANRWAMVTPEEKNQCEGEAAKDKVRYENEFRAYSQRLAAEQGVDMEQVEDGVGEGVAGGHGGAAAEQSAEGPLQQQQQQQQEEGELDATAATHQQEEGEYEEGTGEGGI